MILKTACYVLTRKLEQELHAKYQSSFHDLENEDDNTNDGCLVILFMVVVLVVFLLSFPFMNETVYVFNQFLFYLYFGSRREINLTIYFTEDWTKGVPSGPDNQRSWILNWL